MNKGKGWTDYTCKLNSRSKNKWQQDYTLSKNCIFAVFCCVTFYFCFFSVLDNLSQEDFALAFF